MVISRYMDAAIYSSLPLIVLSALVCSHLLVQDCVSYTNCSYKMNKLTHMAICMADYISVAKVLDYIARMRLLKHFANSLLSSPESSPQSSPQSRVQVLYCPCIH